ncbi:hypothetical protein [Legionella tunisiensis]|uniref:hypothetical protein n=1 Tax=Legionella tunisiensis TaxID=1034944 RepID=UPI001E4C4A15|nr:hypothetical protein [Legionella tunisiensis]
MTPFYILNPLAWIWLPGHVMELVDDVVGALISAVTIVIHPAISVIRTLSSMIFGYEEGTDCDWGVDEEEKDLDQAMTIGVFS